MSQVEGVRPTLPSLFSALKAQVSNLADECVYVYTLQITFQETIWVQKLSLTLSDSQSVESLRFNMNALLSWKCSEVTGRVLILLVNELLSHTHSFF